MCPHCKVNVAMDKKYHEIVQPDRLVCKVAKLVYKVQEKTVTVTNDQIMNNILVLSDAYAKFVGELDSVTKNHTIIQNNLLNLKNRIEALENQRIKELKMIQGLALDVVSIVQALHKLYPNLKLEVTKVKDLDDSDLEKEESEPKT